MTVTVKPVDFELAWPRELLRSGLSALINVSSDSQEWANRVELLLEDAFVDSAARAQFVSIASGWPSSTGRVDERRQFMAEILRRLDSLPELRPRRPFWSERTNSATAAPRTSRADRPTSGTPPVSTSHTVMTTPGHSGSVTETRQVVQVNTATRSCSDPSETDHLRMEPF